MPMTLEGATRWLRCVRRWAATLRNDLRADAFPAPGDVAQRWLLDVPEHVVSDMLASTVPREIHALLCRGCVASFSRVADSDVRAPVVEMFELCLNC